MSLHKRTPLLLSAHYSDLLGHPVMLKMDNLQPSGSFKLRGLGYMCQHAQSQKGAKRIVCCSGGNAGYSVAYACSKLGLSCTIVVPSTTPPAVREKIQKLGAEIVVFGDVFDEAEVHAKRLAQAEDDTCYVSPFDSPEIWTGHMSLIEELVAEMPNKPGLIVVAVGGGGLFCGVIQGLKTYGWDDVPVLAMGTEGANSFDASFRAGKLVTIPAITSLAKTLGAKTVAQQAFDDSQRHMVFSRVVSDQTATRAVISFLDEYRMGVELSCGAALASVLSPSLIESCDPALLKPEAGPVVVIVCGGVGFSLDAVSQWKALTTA